MRPVDILPEGSRVRLREAIQVGEGAYARMLLMGSLGEVRESYQAAVLVDFELVSGVVCACVVPREAVERLAQQETAGA